MIEFLISGRTKTSALLELQSGSPVLFLLLRPSSLLYSIHVRSHPHSLSFWPPIVLAGHLQNRSLNRANPVDSVATLQYANSRKGSN